MKLVLLSGGSGKRLWPLSNDARSKQFLKVLRNASGERESMVQRVWSQLEAVGLADSAIIATNATQVDIIQSQIGHEVPLVVEPQRRDTFPAIALAASYLHSVLKTDPNEIVAILPVDPFVETDFFQKVKELEKLLHESQANLALMGILPTFPSEKYGYIVPEQTKDGQWLTVSHFQEKPRVEEAEELLRQEALWNSGVFAFKLDYLLSLLRARGFSTDYDELLDQYEALPKISFDYEVVEKEEEIVALTYDGYWKDLGTWNTLSDEMGMHQMGKGILHDDCVNTHLINELDIPVAVIGGRNLIVAAGPDGILVSDKEQSPKIKELVNSYNNQPRFEEHSWGWCKVLDETLGLDGVSVQTRRLQIHEGSRWKQAMPNHQSEVWTVIGGNGELTLDGQVIEVASGSVLTFRMESSFELIVKKDLEVISVRKESVSNQREFIEQSI